MSLNAAKKLLFLIVASCFFSISGQAAKSKPVKLEKKLTAISPINLKIVYGERVTNYSISKSKTAATIDFSNNLGIKNKKLITSEDYLFLKSKLTKLPGKPNSIEFCMRNYIAISQDSNKTIACLGSPNAYAKGALEVTNLISLLF